MNSFAASMRNGRMIIRAILFVALIIVAGSVATTGEAANTATLRFTPTNDSFTSKNNPNKNYNATDVLQVSDRYARCSSFAKAGCINDTRNSYLKFRITGLPDNATITSVKLKLHAKNGSRDGGAIYKTDSNWSENTLTWNNAPHRYNTKMADIGRVIAGKWKWVTLSSTAVKKNTYIGFVIMNDDRDWAAYHTKESYTNKPQLIVNYETTQQTTPPNQDQPSITPVPPSGLKDAGIGVGPPSGWKLSSKIQFSNDVFSRSGSGPLVIPYDHTPAIVSQYVGARDEGTSNAEKPNVKENFYISKDAGSTNGQVLAFRAGWGQYKVNKTGDNYWDHHASGTHPGGPTLARGWLLKNKQGEGWDFPLHMQVRFRNPTAGQANGYKTALMLWPSPSKQEVDTKMNPRGPNWNYELDWHETSGIDKSKWKIAHHVDQNGDGKALEQKTKNMYGFDMTQWQVMDVRIDAGKTTYWINGKKVYEVTEPNWYPASAWPDAGIWFGRRIHGIERQNIDPKAEDIIHFDWFRIWQP